MSDVEGAEVNGIYVRLDAYCCVSLYFDSFLKKWIK